MDVPRVVPPPQRKDSSSPGQKQHSFDEAKQQAADKTMNQTVDASKEAGSLQQSMARLGGPPMVFSG